MADDEMTDAFGPASEEVKLDAAAPLTVHGMGAHFRVADQPDGRKYFYWCNDPYDDADEYLMKAGGWNYSFSGDYWYYGPTDPLDREACARYVTEVPILLGFFVGDKCFRVNVKGPSGRRFVNDFLTRDEAVDCAQMAVTCVNSHLAANPYVMSSLQPRVRANVQWKLEFGDLRIPRQLSLKKTYFLGGEYPNLERAFENGTATYYHRVSGESFVDAATALASIVAIEVDIHNGFLEDLSPVETKEFLTDIRARHRREAKIAAAAANVEHFLTAKGSLYDKLAKLGAQIGLDGPLARPTEADAKYICLGHPEHAYAEQLAELYTRLKGLSKGYTRNGIKNKVRDFCKDNGIFEHIVNNVSVWKHYEPEQKEALVKSFEIDHGNSCLSDLLINFIVMPSLANKHFDQFHDSVHKYLMMTKWGQGAINSVVAALFQKT